MTLAQGHVVLMRNVEFKIMYQYVHAYRDTKAIRFQIADKYQSQLKVHFQEIFAIHHPVGPMQFARMEDARVCQNIKAILIPDAVQNAF